MIGKLIILILVLLVGYIAYGTIPRVYTRRKKMKGIRIKNGRVFGVDMSCAESTQLRLPLHRFLRRNVELLLISIIISVSLIAIILTHSYINKVWNGCLLFLCVSLYGIYGCIISIVNYPKIWFDMEGIHMSERIPENKDFVAKDALIAISTLFVTICSWGIYMQVFQLKTIPAWPLVCLVLYLAVTYFLYTHRKENQTLVKKNDQLLYDQLENGFLLNDIEWKDIERIEYNAQRHAYWEYRLPIYRIDYRWQLDVIFKEKKYDSISLALNDGLSLCENVITLYRYDHRIFLPLAILCKAHGVSFICTAKRL